MPYIRFPLTNVSPMFLKGSNQKAPELRVPSVRGQIRFWLRAIIGAETQDSQIVYERESAIMGSTSVASSVTMQLQEDEIAEAKYQVLPHSSQKRFSAQAIDVNSTFKLKVILRPGTQMPPLLSNAISLWLLLGGVGMRSRRMFGSVQMASRPRKSKGYQSSVESHPEWWDNWDRIAQREGIFPKLVDIQRQLALSQMQVQPVRREPSFPILHPDYCRIIVGNQAFATASEANIALFNILRRDKYRKHEEMYGSGKPRRASPIIAQVRRFADGYYPVITAMRSPMDRSVRARWDVVDDLLDTFEAEFDGTTIMGGKLNR